MEPDIAFIDAATGWASIAISLKRIADCMERQEVRASGLSSGLQSYAGLPSDRHAAEGLR
jgi:hypothetical protein